MTAHPAPPLPLWYKGAVIYELHVRSYHDSTADGVGDFRGLIQKLDYLQDLGVTALWLLPFYPSPLKDDGYDIADYTGVHPAYGTLRDFKIFLDEAHRRDLRVITELVLNHTSDQHPWFQRARHARPGSPERDFYVWSDSPEKYQKARVIFQDYEQSNWSWDPIANAYYWHRFYAHQPDLNYENPAVREAIFEVVDFWLGLGVDGLRLDAVPYLAEEEGTPSENLPETHQILKELRRQIDARYADRMLLAEANQWPEDAAAYFGDGDECHMAFHFPLMPRLFMALRTEDRFPIVDILDQTPVIPETCQWALFLRNHDELTLEMVTDEERLYMYRIFAETSEARVNLGIRRRLAPLLGNNRRRIELLNGLLCSLPGTPVIYYGDEIGMGDNVYLGDRDSVRTPMQWSADRNAGFSRAHPHRLYLPLIVDPEYHHDTIQVDAQQQNPHSLLSWMKRLIGLRKRHQAFGRGSLEFLRADNHKVLAFVRRDENETILVVANLSRFVQDIELDLRAYRGSVPIELFGRTPFRPVGDAPYPLTLGPHAFYWFSLEPRLTADGREAQRAEPPLVMVRAAWDEVVRGAARGALEDVLPAYLATRPWFGGKARRVLAATIREAIAVPTEGGVAYLTLVRVTYADGDPETYVLPLTFAPGPLMSGQNVPAEAQVVRLRASGDGEAVEGTLYDAVWDDRFCRALLAAHRRGRRGRLRGAAGAVVAMHTSAWARMRSPETLTPLVVRGEQNHTSVVFGDGLVLKLFRRVEAGGNPEWDIGRFLTEQRFAHVPPLVGGLEYRPGQGEPTMLAVIHGFVPNDGDAWDYTQGALEQFFAATQSLATTAPPAAPPSARVLVDLVGQEPPIGDVIGTYLAWARLLGRRTAELHGMLASESTDPAFVPQPFTPFAQRALYQALRSQARRASRTLRQTLHGQPESERGLAQAVLAREEVILDRFREVLARRPTVVNTRIHGDYHLGQVLIIGDDLAIIDFEGEPDRPLAERRLRRSPLRDVAAMLRSFHYAAEIALGEQAGPDRSGLEPWARSWQLWVSAAFLDEYLRTADGAPFLPASRDDLVILLDAFLLAQAVHEVTYELNRRPDWVGIPLRGVLQLLEPPPTDSTGASGTDAADPGASLP